MTEPRTSLSVDGKRATKAAARLAAEVLAAFTPEDEREEAFTHIHLHGFIDAYEEVRASGLDPHAFVEAMLVESPQEKLLSDAQRVIDEAFKKKEAKKNP